MTIQETRDMISYYISQLEYCCDEEKNEVLSEIEYLKKKINNDKL